MKIYENVIIGNFLYILGLYDGARMGSSALAHRAVSLLQQTPLDKSIADVLVQSPASIYIIEFKRKGASERKEDTKKKNLKAALSNLPELEQLSKKIHWYVKSDLVDSDLQLEVKPYLGTEKEPDLTSLENLVKKIIDKPLTAYNIGACEKYLTTLRLASKIAEKGGKGASSGTVVLLAAGDDGFRHAVLNDLTDIFEVHSQLVAPIMERGSDASYPLTMEGLSWEAVDDIADNFPSFTSGQANERSI